MSPSLGDVLSKAFDPLGLFSGNRHDPTQFGQNGHQDGPDGLHDHGPDHPVGENNGNGNAYAYGRDGGPGNGRGGSPSGAADGGHPSGPPGLPSLPGAPAASLPSAPGGPSLNIGPILSLVQQVAQLPAAIVSTLLGQNFAPPSGTTPAATPPTPATPGSTLPPAAAQAAVDARGAAPGVTTVVQTASQVVPAVVQGAGQLLSTLAQAVAPGTTPSTLNPAGDARAALGVPLNGQPPGVMTQTAVTQAATTAQTTTAMPVAATQPPIAGQVPSNAPMATAQTAATLASAQTANLPAGGAATLAQPVLSPAAAQTLVAGTPAQLAPTGIASNVVASSVPVPTTATANPLAAPPMASLPSAVPTAMAAAGTTANSGQIATLANVPLGQMLAVDPRAALPLGAGERGLALRAEAGMIAGYTGDGIQRRPLRSRLDALLTTPMGQLLTAFGAAGNTSARSRIEAEQRAERDLQRAMQWVFWVLAVVAYGCVALTLISLLASGGGAGDAFKHIGGGRSAPGDFAIIGLTAAGLAWWLARRLARR